ncbi:hypothetical protein LCGC14_1384300 [marine sediment metagenome]|uniref:Uncharacterized protein n=1 Tax=marine sediment metagenome TaxID=412755 RepID=A0A0F9N3B9_9ZZZZ
MPEPGYLDGDSPGCLWLFVGTVATAIVLALIKSCV